MKTNVYLKFFIAIAMLFIIFSIDTCLKQISTDSDGDGSYLIKQVENVPDGWTDSKKHWDVLNEHHYYYNVDTKIVYFGSYEVKHNDRSLIKLESEQYSCYLYDEQNNEFVGVERNSKD